MARYREARDVDALTWDEIRQAGVESGAKLYEGMPVRFQIGWRPVMMLSLDSFGVTCTHGLLTVNKGEALVVTDRDMAFVVTEQELSEKFELIG